jgi:D-alanyl-lipoteichoic acid acyltransferase DltB (MBOAT superfamily)
MTIILSPMLFNSLEFALFLPTVLLLYYALRHKQQNILLLIASYIFYGFWDVRFLSLIVVSTVVDYSVALWVERAREAGNGRQAQIALMISLATNLGLLGFFKYFNFFVASFIQLFALLGITLSPTTLHIILPVGISFYTFQTLSYTIDVYRGSLKPTRNFFDFALFVSFFPQLVAGPIERAVNLLPQIQKPRIVTQAHLEQGIHLIVVGLVRKVVVADTAGLLADRYFNAPGNYTSLDLIAGILLYSLQIYGDFAGYSNIARGVANLLGFDLMRNFQHPYFALNVTDFWRRWHISLSTWLRDYLYIPLGGNRRGTRRTYVNLMLTMLLGGLWHGASWNFVIWGGLHGLYLALHRYLGAKAVPSTKPSIGQTIKQSSGAFFTFCLVAFTWLFFRMPDWASTQRYLAGLARFDFGGGLALVPLLLLVLIILIIDIPQARFDDEYYFLRYPSLMRGAVMAEAILLILFMSGGQNAPFIYFQF